MKRFALVAAVAVTVGLAAYGLTRQMAAPPAPGTELAWMVQEFRLTPEQAKEIETLHAAYAPVCARHCAQIFTIRARLAELSNAGQTHSPAYREAQAEMTRLIEVCNRSTRAHLQAVAAAMPSEAGQRYLALVEPKLSGHDHTQPFGLQ
jgi:hypothetical protein